MSAGQKVGLGATLLAALGILFAQGAAPHLLPLTQFLFEQAAIFAALPMFDDVLIAMFCGVAASVWLPHLLPASWPAARTRRVTSLLAFAVAFMIVVSTYRNLIGLQYGLFAGSSAVMVSLLGIDWYYSRARCRRPGSLEDEA